MGKKRIFYGNNHISLNKLTAKHKTKENKNIRVIGVIVSWSPFTIPFHGMLNIRSTRMHWIEANLLFRYFEKSHIKYESPRNSHEWNRIEAQIQFSRDTQQCSKSFCHPNVGQKSLQLYHVIVKSLNDAHKIPQEWVWKLFSRVVSYKLTFYFNHQMILSMMDGYKWKTTKIDAILKIKQGNILSHIIWLNVAREMNCSSSPKKYKETLVSNALRWCNKKKKANKHQR